jgi:hypothetical protein
MVHPSLNAAQDDVCNMANAEYNRDMARKTDDHQLQKDMAKYLAMAVRNAMEDFHCEHLSDEQMKQLNPIVRNAIYTALVAAKLADRSDKATMYLDFQAKCIPSYWEEPELLQDFGH